MKIKFQLTAVTQYDENMLIRQLYADSEIV